MTKMINKIKGSFGQLYVGGIALVLLICLLNTKVDGTTVTVFNYASTTIRELIYYFSGCVVGIVVSLVVRKMK